MKGRDVFDLVMVAALFGGGMRELMQHWRPITMMAFLHYALPFSLFAYALLTLTGSFTAIINASSPLFVGGLVILLGTGLSTGLLKPRGTAL